MENTAIAIRPDAPLTAAEIRANVQLVQQVMKAVMKADTHYGTIPGTQKPTLYKAGSEVLLLTFRIAVEPEVEDMSTPDEIRYRVRAKAVHQVSGGFLGSGIGECSSSEEKYRWRAAVCDAEWDETAEDRRRSVWKKGKDKNPPYQIKQVRTNPADVANTVLKMAKKRAQIDMTLTVTAASDIFTQDLEDMPPEIINQGGEQKPGIKQPQRKSDAATGTGLMLVDEIKVAKGGTKEKPWTRYDIFIGGEKHGTFDSAHAEVAERARLEGLPVKVEFKVGKFGKSLTSIEIVQPSAATAEKPGSEAPMPGMAREIIDRLMGGGQLTEADAQARLDECLTEMKAGKGKYEMETLENAIIDNPKLGDALLDTINAKGW